MISFSRVPCRKTLRELDFLQDDPAAPHSVVLQIKFPNRVAATKEWIFKIGNEDGAHQMIWFGQNNLECGISGQPLIRNVPLMKHRDEVICLACVWDGGFYRVYINGKQVKLTRLKGAKIASNEFRVFGRREVLKAGMPEYGFTGDIERIELYKGALTDLELGSLTSFE